MEKSSSLFAGDNSLHRSGCPPSFCKRACGEPPIRPRFMANVKMSSPPLTSTESYKSNTTRRRRDGQQSGLSSHHYHEGDTLVNESSQYYCSVWSIGPRAIGKEPRLHILEFLWALSFLPSYISSYIIQNPSLSIAYGSCEPAQCSTQIQPVNSKHDF